MRITDMARCHRRLGHRGDDNAMLGNWRETYEESLRFEADTSSLGSKDQELLSRNRLDLTKPIQIHVYV
jgi:hypothetical protein